MDKKFTVLFICTGNSCRSPMAEGILKKMIPAACRHKISVLSAGTGGFVNMPATDHAVDVAAEQGIDIGDHLSRGVTQSLLQNTHLILAMARDHERFIRAHFPRYTDNVFTLKAFDRKPGWMQKVNIADPIGRDKENYRKIYGEIEREIKRILPRILQLADAFLAESNRNDDEDETD